MTQTEAIARIPLSTAVFRAIGGVPSVLVVDPDDLLRATLDRTLTAAGFTVTLAASVDEALERMDEALPDVVVSDVDLPGTDGLQFGRLLRADPQLRTVPLVFLSARAETTDVVAGLRAGADDYLTKPFTVAELVARLRAKVERRPVPVDLLPDDPRTGLVSAGRLRDRLDLELSRPLSGSRPGAVAVLEFPELAALHDRFGPRTIQVLLRQVSALLTAEGLSPDLVGRDRESFQLLLPETDPEQVERQLSALAEVLVDTAFGAGTQRIRLTPVVGWAPLAPAVDAEELLARAEEAAAAAAGHLDLRPRRWTADLAGRGVRHRRHASARRLSLRTPLQVAATLVLGVVAPFLGYQLLDRLGWDVSGVAYLVVVVALLVTAVSIWVEGFLALAPELPPERIGAPYPAASAVIAAYLPNEAATVVETVEAFLRVDYPGPLQVVLAYNTPQDLPVEAALQRLAQQHPRFLPLRVEASTSKAQNLNAALAHVTGDFVGVFDADHLPEPDAFRRAWRWLSNGTDVVQGHAVVRNGAESAVARTVAVEFEAIYGVSHPGRARLHGFGLFGGSNGFWRTDLLRSTRMRAAMLTEDIDSSMRVVAEGYRVASDPALVSRELAPTTWRALWHQRMRWAQGWFQVSLRHVGPVLRSRHLSVRQKSGALFLLGWREVYPWLSLQILPVLAFKITQAGGASRLGWLIPLFVLSTLFTLSVGPGQVVFAYLNAHPSIRRHRRWFWAYLLVASVFYTEFKNVIARVAQVKELTGDRAWRVTPREASAREDDRAR